MGLKLQLSSNKFDKKQIVALIVAAMITALIYIYRDSIYQLETLGYLGVFLISLIGNATIILPAPVLLFVFAAGGTLPSPLLVGLLAGAGATLGEMTGYLAGYGSSSFIEHNRTFIKIRSWVEKFGSWAIGLLAFLPNPFFDLAGFAAGTLGMRLKWFLSATFIGKTAKMLLVAYAGSLSIEWIKIIFL